MTETSASASRFSLTHVSLCVAALSFGAAMFQGYVNSRNLEIVQRDIGRREHIRACREAIEGFFDVKLRIARMIELARPGAAPDAFDANMAVSRFGAIGTYLANFQGEDARYDYTLLTRELQRLVDAAKAGGVAADDSFFKAANGMFDKMNSDCVRSSRVSLQ